VVEGLVEKSYEGVGWLKMSEYRRMGGGVLKLLKKLHMIFERSPGIRRIKLS